MKHQASGADIDLSIGLLPFEIEAIDRAVTTEVEDFAVRVATPEDLIIMKAIASREKDWLDVANIVDSRTDLDTEYIRNGVREFSDLLGDFRAAEKLENYLSG